MRHIVLAATSSRQVPEVPRFKRNKSINCFAYAKRVDPTGIILMDMVRALIMLGDVLFFHLRGVPISPNAGCDCQYLRDDDSVEVRLVQDDLFR